MLIGLNQKLLCSTSGWHNNCGLNCLVHFLFDKLESGELQQIARQSGPYPFLLETFIAFYQLPESCNWEDVKSLLQSYPNPIDREAILAPVLRRHLGELLIANATHVWNTDASAALSTFLVSGEVDDIAGPFYLANQDAMDKFKKNFVKELAEGLSAVYTNLEENAALDHLLRNKRALTPENIKDQIAFMRRNEMEDNYRKTVLKDFWFRGGGAQNYGKYIGNLSNSTMISSEHLSILSQPLQIGLEIYTPDSIKFAAQKPGLKGAQHRPDREYRWTLKIYNHGEHWEYEEPLRDLRKVAEHNRFYAPSVIPEFKTRGHNPEPKVEEKIKTAIKAKFISLKKAPTAQSVRPLLSIPRPLPPLPSSPEKPEKPGPSSPKKR